MGWEGRGEGVCGWGSGFLRGVYVCGFYIFAACGLFRMALLLFLWAFVGVPGVGGYQELVGVLGNGSLFIISVCMSAIVCVMTL